MGTEGFSTFVNDRFTPFAEGVAAQSLKSGAQSGILDPAHPVVNRGLFLSCQGARRRSFWKWFRNVSGYDFDFTDNSGSEIGVDLVDEFRSLMLKLERRAIVRDESQRCAAARR